jgi:hypothetical protein
MHKHTSHQVVANVVVTSSRKQCHATKLFILDRVTFAMLSYRSWQPVIACVGGSMCTLTCWFYCRLEEHATGNGKRAKNSELIGV